MTRDASEIEKVLNGVLEQLASIEHERWSHWQSYMHSQCLRLPDGSLLVPAELAARWESQYKTRYEDLGDKEKNSDREQVMRYLPLVVATLAAGPDPGR
jgi:hypothetical protein